MSLCSSTTVMMKYTSVLVAILAIFGLGLAYPFQDFGTGPQERTLQDELKDFVNLVPMDKVQEIAMEYLTQDTKVQNAVIYLLSSDFHSVLRAIEALKEHQALVVYLEDAGLDVIAGIQALHELIGMEDYVPPEKKLFNSPLKIGDGVKGMLKDIYNALPINDFVALYQDKMQNSKIFEEFVKKMRSQETQTLIDNLYANETFEKFVKTIRENGLELQGLTQLIGFIFDLHFPY